MAARPDDAPGGRAATPDYAARRSRFAATDHDSRRCLRVRRLLFEILTGVDRSRRLDPERRIETIPWHRDASVGSRHAPRWTQCAQLRKALHGDLDAVMAFSRRASLVGVAALLVRTVAPPALGGCARPSSASRNQRRSRCIMTARPWLPGR